MNRVVMTHHHRVGAAPAVPPSLLRLSVSQRLAIASALIVLIWAACWWAAF